MALETGLRVRVFDDYARTNLVDDLTDRMTAGSITTTVHGGFARAKGFRIPMTPDDLSLYFNRGNLPGRHFFHLEVSDGPAVVWEGRIMRTAFGPDGKGGVELRIEGAGYWNSLKDQKYSVTVAGGDTQKDVIEDALTSKAPLISSDYSLIEDPGLDLGSLVITREYPQDMIVNKIPHTSDGTDQWFAYIYETRGADDLPILIYKARSSSVIHWTTSTRELATDWEIAQDGYLMRNTATPIDNGVAGTTQTDANQRATDPTRDFDITVGTGLDWTAEAAEANRVLGEKRLPQQTQTFTIEGKVFRTALTEQREPARLWWVRAGEVIRFENLFPESAVNPQFDSLRTFSIRSTDYNLMADTVSVRPDRAAMTITQVLPRISQIELAR